MSFFGDGGVLAVGVAEGDRRRRLVDEQPGDGHLRGRRHLCWTYWSAIAFDGCRIDSNRFSRLRLLADHRQVGPTCPPTPRTMWHFGHCAVAGEAGVPHLPCRGRRRRCASRARRGGQLLRVELAGGGEQRAAPGSARPGTGCCGAAGRRRRRVPSASSPFCVRVEQPAGAGRVPASAATAARRRPRRRLGSVTTSLAARRAPVGPTSSFGRPSTRPPSGRDRLAERSAGSSARADDRAERLDRLRATGSLPSVRTASVRTSSRRLRRRSASVATASTRSVVAGRGDQLQPGRPRSSRRRAARRWPSASSLPPLQPLPLGRQEQPQVLERAGLHLGGGVAAAARRASSCPAAGRRWRRGCPRRGPSARRSAWVGEQLARAAAAPTSAAAPRRGRRPCRSTRGSACRSRRGWRRAAPGRCRTAMFSAAR